MSASNSGVASLRVPGWSWIAAFSPAIILVSLVFVVASYFTGGGSLGAVLVSIGLGFLFSAGFLEYALLTYITLRETMLVDRKVGVTDFVYNASSIGFYFIFIGIYLIYKKINSYINLINKICPENEKHARTPPTLAATLLLLGLPLIQLQSEALKTTIRTNTCISKEQAGKPPEYSYSPPEDSSSITEDSASL
ncbi:MAG: hypothetical protein LRS48_01640 [Desulfurococcales archaeon]|nr:hypothetical protein [Desulfurococcales archaeon]